MTAILCDIGSMTPEQLRMARAALDWTADRLASESGVGVNTVRRIEKGRGALYDTVLKLQTTLEAAGVEFIGAGEYRGDGGPGVRLRAGEMK